MDVFSFSDLVSGLSCLPNQDQTLQSPNYSNFGTSPPSMFTYEPEQPHSVSYCKPIPLVNIGKTHTTCHRPPRIMETSATLNDSFFNDLSICSGSLDESACSSFTESICGSFNDSLCSFKDGGRESPWGSYESDFYGLDDIISSPFQHQDDFSHDPTLAELNMDDSQGLELSQTILTRTKKQQNLVNIPVLSRVRSQSLQPTVQSFSWPQGDMRHGCNTKQTFLNASHSDDIIKSQASTSTSTLNQFSATKLEHKADLSLQDLAKNPLLLKDKKDWLPSKEKSRIEYTDLFMIRSAKGHTNPGKTLKGEKRKISEVASARKDEQRKSKERLSPNLRKVTTSQMEQIEEEEDEDDDLDSHDEGLGSEHEDHDISDDEMADDVSDISDLGISSIIGPTPKSLRSQRGDYDDWTPNPKRLLQIGKELCKLNKVIADMLPLHRLPPNSRTKSRKEKNKLASRACRLKKKAQHEANKVKLHGLEKEHDNLTYVLSEIKTEVAARSRQHGSHYPFSLSKMLEQLSNDNLGSTIAGHTTEFVNSVLDKAANGDLTGGLEIACNE